jgi:competence protein ComEA
MNANNEFFYGWFGYSRKERRSTFMLFVILLIVIAVRYLVPQKDIKIEDVTGLLTSSDTANGSVSGIKTDTSNLFDFNPNSASYDTLTMLGLSEKQSRTIVSYRSKGGRFRQPSDIKKIYDIDEPTAARLIPYIKIEKDTAGVRYFKSSIEADQKKSERIDLNRSDSAALEKLPWLGPVLSSRIIKYRKLLGGFVSAEQLKEVYGLPQTTYNLLAQRVFADSLAITGINVNNADLKVLLKHPYLTRYDIQAILKYKEIKGKISDISELIDNKILTPEKAKKISPYLRF